MDMFICEKCLKENYLNWPLSFGSIGLCEECNRHTDCHDIPSKDLKLRLKTVYTVNNETGQPMENKEKTLKISLELARKIYKEYKFCQEIKAEVSLSLSAMYDLICENFTKEELEDKKGYTWEESFEPGYQLDSTGLNRVVVRKCVNKVAQDHFKDQFRTEKQALIALAFAQLSHIVAKYNEESKPLELDGEIVAYTIQGYNNGDLKVEEWQPLSSVKPIKFFWFNRREAAEQSLITNRQLWEQYWNNA